MSEVIPDEELIHRALLLAADHLERRPRLCRFFSYRPTSCNTPGCALGWISFFADSPGDSHRGALPLLGFTGDGVSGAWWFYDLMDEITNHGPWRDDGLACAAALRKLAEARYSIIGFGFATFRARALQ